MAKLFVAFLRRLSVPRKLALIYLLDLSAVIFVSGILVHEKFIAIDFARKEIAGNAYVREVVRALVAAGEAGETALPQPAEDVRNAEHQHGAGLQSRELAEAFADGLQAVPTAAERSDGTVRQRLLERGHALLTRIGNQSNLILDPDLDSYYTMSVVLLRYPQLLELTSQIRRVAGDRGSDAPSRYLELEGRLDACLRAIESDYEEAYVASAGYHLRDQLRPLHRDLAMAVEQLRHGGRAVADGQAQPASLAAAERAVLGRLQRSWVASTDALDHLLRARVDGFFARMWLHLGGALFLLLAILGVVVVVARQISTPLRRLTAAADQVGRTGDHQVRAQWNSQDEIGRLVTQFNDMLGQLAQERSAQQELAATARAAQAQQHMMEALPMAMVVTSVPEHQVLHANAAAQDWLGDCRHDPWSAGLAPEVRSKFFLQLAEQDRVDEFEVQWLGGAQPAWAVLSARQLVYQGQPAVITTFAPVNHLKQMEQRLELWAKVFESSPESIMIVDDRRSVVTVNPAFCRQTGFEPADVVGQRPEAFVEGADKDGVFENVWLSLDKRSTWQGELAIRRRSDDPFPAWLVANTLRDGEGAPTYTIFSSLDVSERKANEARIHFLAHHDVLTGLPNRTLFTERLRMALQHAKRASRRVAVLFIDLDRFKTINDSLGHQVGDGLLRSVAQRLLDAVRDGDTVARLGGDEFVVALNNVADSDEVLGVVERRLIPLVRREHAVGGAELHVSCSIGIALYPDDSRNIEELMRHADVAMFQAKALGRDSASFFTPELNERAHKRLRVESLLRHALDRHELELHYQPRVDAATGALVAVEALLRWHSADLGEVMPADFVPIAEESRLIVPIGAWVIGEACRQHAAWREVGLHVPISINVSGVQLRDPALMGALREALARHEVDPRAIELELTESTLMVSARDTLNQLHALKQLGVMLSIDDFGTGYSSLNYLRRFPVDRLKIDQSFVHDLLTEEADTAITKAIIGLGHTLGLRVVAEGVESAGAAQTLHAAGCDELQGFHFSPAMPATQFVRWAVERSGRPAAHAGT